jgi:hypothetical protein
MKRKGLVPALGATFAAALAATACADYANQDFIVSITDESSSDAQQSAERLTLRALPNAKVNVRLAAADGGSRQYQATRTPDGRIAGDDRFLECYNFARAVVTASRQANFAPATLAIDAGLMSAAVPLAVNVVRSGDGTLSVTAASRGMLSDGRQAVPAGVRLEGVVGFDGDEPTAAAVRETMYLGNTSLPSHATTCRLAPAPQQA